jgi:subtilase family serine protease
MLLSVAAGTGALKSHASEDFKSQISHLKSHAPVLHYDSKILKFAAAAGVAGYTPAQIRRAYGFDQISLTGGAAADGTGQTIAIVDAYNAPTIRADLAVFDQQFGLAPPPNFSIVNQNGGSSLPALDSGWAGEISLDVEWAHAIAPNANIVLVEANSASIQDLMAAVNTARNLPGVTTVSSWRRGTAGFTTARSGPPLRRTCCRSAGRASTPPMPPAPTTPKPPGPARAVD